MTNTALERAIAFLHSWLGYRFAQTGLPGLCIAISHKGRIVFSQAYGYADTEQGHELQTNHLFGVASQTKMFVATAIMQLVQASHVELDKPVDDYLPWFRAHPQASAREITVRQLLVHSAGLSRDLPDADFWQLTKPFPRATALRHAILQTPVVLEPNTKLKYSNTGYALLGQIIEQASGEPYGSYITQHIIERLGLKTTFADYMPELAARTVTGYGIPYGPVRSRLEHRQPANALAPVAGIRTTAEDMCRFAQALCMGSSALINDRSKKELQRSHWVQTDGYDAGIELGLGFEAMAVGRRRVVGHSGHIAGHLTATYFDPYDQLAVSICANSKDAPSPRIATDIIEILDYFSDHAARPAPPTLAKFNARVFSPIATVEIIATASGVIAINPDNWQPFAFCEELEPVDDTTLRITTPGSIFNEGELVRYTFQGGAVASITYAGCTLLPEDTYRKQLQKSAAYEHRSRSTSSHS